MEIILILHNIRSVYNIGSIFRTAEGFGVQRIFLSGYTPSPDNGLPHVRAKISKQLHKTALGAEKLVSNYYVNDVNKLIDTIKKSNFKVIGLEQDPRATSLQDLLEDPAIFIQTEKTALLLGEEVHGITYELRDKCDLLIEIPMLGQKESFNVSVATGIALFVFTSLLRNLHR